MIRIFNLTFLVFLFLITKANSLIEIDITRGNLDPLPIAVSPLFQNDVSKKNSISELKQTLEKFIKDTVEDKNNKDIKKVTDILNKNAVHFDELGVINSNQLIIDEKTKLTIDELKTSNKNWLINFMSE